MKTMVMIICLNNNIHIKEQALKHLYSSDRLTSTSYRDIRVFSITLLAMSRPNFPYRLPSFDQTGWLSVKRIVSMRMRYLYREYISSHEPNNVDKSASYQIPSLYFQNQAHPRTTYLSSPPRLSPACQSHHEHLEFFPRKRRCT